LFRIRFWTVRGIGTYMVAMGIYSKIRGKRIRGAYRRDGGGGG
jgi:hypothetical protein